MRFLCGINWLSGGGAFSFAMGMNPTSRLKFNEFCSRSMKSSNALLFLIIIAIAGSLVVIYAAIFIIEQAQLDSNSSVPIYAGLIAFLAAIVSAIFQEVSARYKEKRARADKIWQLVFPIMKDGYIPWIEHAKKLSNALNEADAAPLQRLIRHSR